MDKHSTKEEAKAILDRLREHAKTRMADQGIDEDRAMREIMLDWAASNGDKVSAKERKAMTQACVYFIFFVDKGFEVPWQIRERLTPEVVAKLVNFLKDAEPK